MTSILSDLPALREEITLIPAPRAMDGSPTWTLHDPGSARFFRIGWREFEMLARWELNSVHAIAHAISNETTLRVTPKEVELFREHLARSHLFRPKTPEDRIRFLEWQRQSKPHWLSWMLHNYLFMRIPLWHPDPFLRRTLPVIEWMFDRKFLLFIVMMALWGVGLIVRQWEAYTTTFLYFFNFSGSMAYAGVFLISKIMHELGHAYTAHRFGCRVPTMGVAFLVMWPVLFTETSDVWKLVSRWHRMAVGLAGMATELMLAALATLAWSFLPDGVLRSGAFLLSSGLWVVTLAVNLNPLMRFDGYFLLSDAMEMPNLQERAFALARWRLREWLFGLGALPPEPLALAKRRILITFAFAVWTYRFFLFIGIALLVYHYFFKLLGLFLFLVEIGWFVLRPIGREIMTWYEQRAALCFNRHLVRTILLIGSLVIWSVLPWRFSTDEYPATLEALNHSVIYAPAAAQVRLKQVVSGQRVEKGDLLWQFADDDLQYRLESIARTIEQVRWRLSTQGVEFSGSGRDDIPVERDPILEQELYAAQAEQRAILADLEKLRVTAPFSGIAVDVAEDVAIGDWVAAKEVLLTVIDASRPVVKGYVSEVHFNGIPSGAKGVFYPENSDLLPLTGHLLRKDQTTTRFLNEPYLASVHGGSLPVREDRSGKLVVEGALYRVDLELDREFPVHQVIRGVITLETSPESLLARLWRRGLEIMIRESGF
ncbi:MAG: peptidase M50 [Magnetococcus sp. YQC-5]